MSLQFYEWFSEAEAKHWIILIVIFAAVLLKSF